MPSTYINLFNAADGALLAKVDAGHGLRAKSWLEEIPEWMMEASQNKGLSQDGVGRSVNYPSFLDGSLLTSNPIGGQTTPQGSFSGVSVFRVVPNSFVLGVGDASETDFGQEAPAQDDPTHADYLNTGSDPANPPSPRGATTPAWVNGDGNATEDTTGGNNILTLIVNGATYTVTLVSNAALAIADIRDAIVQAGVPVEAIITGAGNILRLITRGKGKGQTIQVPQTSAGAIIFTSAGATVYRGNGGPLTDLSAESYQNGILVSRRVLPGSVVVVMTMGAEVVTVTDNGDGTLSGSNAAGTVTVTGTITYTTGAINLDTVGDAPDNATNVVASWKSLVPLRLHEPVRLPAGLTEIALLF